MLSVAYVKALEEGYDSGSLNLGGGWTNLVDKKATLWKNLSVQRGGTMFFFW